METTGKIKYYKNAARSKKNNIAPYIPQYVLHDIKPIDRTNLNESTKVVVVPPSVEETKESNLDMDSNLGMGFLPKKLDAKNKTVFSSVDGEILESSDENIQPSHPMIDNNNFIEEKIEIEEENNIKEKSEIEDIEASLSLINESTPNDLFLFIDQKLFASGSKLEIENIANQLIFGEHPEFKNIQVPVENILILKKIKINIGLFLE